MCRCVHVANLLTSSGGDYSRAYIDVKDAQWLLEGDLKPLDVNSISPSQFVIYRFGVFVIRILNKFIQTPEVRVAHVAMYMYMVVWCIATFDLLLKLPC